MGRESKIKKEPKELRKDTRKKRQKGGWTLGNQEKPQGRKEHKNKLEVKGERKEYTKEAH